MIFAIYYTHVGESFITKFLELFPHVKEDVDERFPEDVNEEISLCFRSIKRLHPNARCVLLTDLHTNIETLDDVEIIRNDLDPNEPAYMRLLAQIRFLESVDPSEKVIFCDYDILFQKPLKPLFEKTFDLGLIYRKSYHGKQHPAPINGGLLIIKERDKALHFLKQIHEYFLHHFPHHKAWGGFQASLNEMIGPQKIHDTYPNLITSKETAILLILKKPFSISKVPVRKIWQTTGTHIYHEKIQTPHSLRWDSL